MKITLKDLQKITETERETKRPEKVTESQPEVDETLPKTIVESYKAVSDLTSEKLIAEVKSTASKGREALKALLDQRENDVRRLECQIRALEALSTSPEEIFEYMTADFRAVDEEIAIQDDDDYDDYDEDSK